MGLGNDIFVIGKLQYLFAIVNLNLQYPKFLKIY